MLNSEAARFLEAGGDGVVRWRSCLVASSAGPSPALEGSGESVDPDADGEVDGVEGPSGAVLDDIVAVRVRSCSETGVFGDDEEVLVGEGIMILFRTLPCASLPVASQRDKSWDEIEEHYLD